ncbi:hypothetical protein LJC08_00800 [Methanimicrococcus sp. OttesenSCG-928-J09]|nr:hypothetical protein [Methanimicrococcus sp. OttesenSCG-928-J09]
MTDIIKKVEEFLEGMNPEEVEALLEKYGNSTAPRGSMYMNRAEYLLSELYDERETIVGKYYFTISSKAYVEKDQNELNLSFKIKDTYTKVSDFHYNMAVENNINGMVS